jgi:DNA (cytosine-5)-methyltransferase 1
MNPAMPYSVEVCAGAGGQALGLEQAGFAHQALVELEANYCKTLHYNRPHWRVIQGDLNEFDGREFRGADLFAGGLPCPPFSVAGKQLGARDERNLFPAAVRVIDEIRPSAIMIENVRGFLDPVFAEYREGLRKQLGKLGYHIDWRLLSAASFGVPQFRPRVIIVGLRKDISSEFSWPIAKAEPPPTVGATLFDLMAERGWKGAEAWRDAANQVAPTIVGGSKKHGGPDLGPTRARKAWSVLGVNGLTLAEQAPDPDFEGMPRLTIRMVARLQGFPDNWGFAGKKTIAYRQVGNAFPPPVARAVAAQITQALSAQRSVTTHRALAAAE